MNHSLHRWYQTCRWLKTGTAWEVYCRPGQSFATTERYRSTPVLGLMFCMVKPSANLFLIGHQRCNIIQVEIVFQFSSQLLYFEHRPRDTVWCQSLHLRGIRNILLVIMRVKHVVYWSIQNKSQSSHNKCSSRV